MDCPYCHSQISESAGVCPCCTRDLWLVKPLQAEIKALQQKVKALEAQLGVVALDEGDLAPQAAIHPSEILNTTPQQNLRRWPYLLVSTCGSIGVTLLLHWVFLFIYDVNPLALRISTIVAPALIASLVLRQITCSWRAIALTSVLTGGFAVLGMLMVTGLLDQVPVAPQTMRDWRETLEYAIAIALGFLTGALIAALIRRLLNPTHQPEQSRNLWVLIQRDANGQINIEAISNEVQRLITVLGPVVSGSMALYSGVKSLIS